MSLAGGEPEEAEREAVQEAEPAQKGDVEPGIRGRRPGRAGRQAPGGSRRGADLQVGEEVRLLERAEEEVHASAGWSKVAQVSPVPRRFTRQGICL